MKVFNAARQQIAVHPTVSLLIVITLTALIVRLMTVE